MFIYGDIVVVRKYWLFIISIEVLISGEFIK